jgi:hypothetical protein
MELFDQPGVRIDVYHLGPHAQLSQQRQGVLAQVAASSGVQDDGFHACEEIAARLLYGEIVQLVCFTSCVLFYSTDD